MGTRKDWYIRINDAYEYVINNKYIETVILSDLIREGYSDAENPQEKDSRQILKNGVKRSFEKLKNKKVLVLLDTPILPFYPYSCIDRPINLRKRSNCAFNFKHNLFKIHKETITELANKYRNVRVFDLSKLFCSNEKCNVLINNCLMFQDSNHLSIEGSKYVAPFIANEISKFN